MTYSEPVFGDLGPRGEALDELVHAATRESCLGRDRRKGLSGIVHRCERESAFVRAQGYELFGFGESDGREFVAGDVLELAEFASHVGDGSADRRAGHSLSLTRIPPLVQISLDTVEVSLYTLGMAPSPTTPLHVTELAGGAHVHLLIAGERFDMKMGSRRGGLRVFRLTESGWRSAGGYSTYTGEWHPDTPERIINAVLADVAAYGAATGLCGACGKTRGDGTHEGKALATADDIAAGVHLRCANRLTKTTTAIPSSAA